MSERGWWLTNAAGTTFGPFSLREVATRWRRYRWWRRYSEASRRACWANAAEPPSAGDLTP